MQVSSSSRSVEKRRGRKAGAEVLGDIKVQGRDSSKQAWSFRAQVTR